MVAAIAAIATARGANPRRVELVLYCLQGKHNNGGGSAEMAT
jgi:hypothetical protein